MELRRREEFLLDRLGKMLKEQMRLHPALRDEKEIAMLKAVIKTVRQQLKERKQHR